MMSSTSPPEQNARPSPVRTSARTSSCVPACVDDLAQLAVDGERERVEAVGAAQRDGRRRRSRARARSRTLGRDRHRSLLACEERLAQLPEQAPQLAPLGRVERRQQLGDVRRVHREERLDELAPLGGEQDAREAPVARIGPALDDAVALGAVDEAREVARRDEHPPAERRERLPVLALEVREQIEARHRAVVGEAAAHLARASGCATRAGAPTG